MKIKSNNKENMDYCEQKAVLSDTNILNEKENGHIIIEPLNHLI